MENAANRGPAAGLAASPYFYPCLLALALVPLYLYSLPPVLPPYRDAGEMVCAAWTLGVAHQPGYPLYLLAAKLFSALPLGNPAWRLSLFSAAAALAGVLAFWRFAARAYSPASAFAAALALGFNFTLRTLGGVPEMYALHFFFACLLLALASAPDEELPARARLHLAAFLLGLGMANRMDLLLIAPALLALLWPALRAGGFADLFRAAGFFLLGFSLYLYLPARSCGNPLFDWSHPADLKTFLAVITRKSYGSTLDLISVNYAPGELFLPNLKLYARHALANFGGFLPLCAAGAYAEWRGSRLRFAGLAALFFFSGPVFLYMANMPPNPHAAAIVEPYYLLPDLALAAWAAAGLAWLAASFPRVRAALAVYAVLAAGLAYHNGARAADRRYIFAAEDYASDVLRSAPHGAAVVAKKDVQLFSLWYLQSVLGERPDLKIVSQGLSASPWYARTAALHRPGMALYNLNSGDAGQWNAFAASYPAGAYATLDAEVPRGVPVRPAGLLNELRGKAEPADPWPYYSLGRLDTDYVDFFDRDIGVSYAQALMSRLTAVKTQGPAELADTRLARLLDDEMPDAALYEGFYHSGKGDWPAAAAAFRESAGIYERLLSLSDDYHSLPELKARLAAASSYAWLNYGVALEKGGDRAGAESAYQEALRKNPDLAEAHYNMAILYWNRDPGRVRLELRETLRLDPAHPGALRYVSRVN